MDSRDNEQKTGSLLSDSECIAAGDAGALWFSMGNPEVEVVQGHCRMIDDIHSASHDAYTVLCAVDVPCHIPVAEFCQIVAAYEFPITHMKVVAPSGKAVQSMRQGNHADGDDASASTNIASTYWVFLAFSTHETAMAFYISVDGARYNSVESECFRIRLVADIQFADGSYFEIAISGDLGQCPVCLDVLHPAANSHGIISALCNHLFHSACLSKWTNSSGCPVCRYCMQPQQPSTCETCGLSEQVWICLICGHCGCSRYANGHAVLHFEQRGHALALDVESQKVWDYAGADFVDRIVQSRSGAKLVAMQSETSNNDTTSQRMTAVKLEGLCTEYNRLLASQLDAARTFHVQRRETEHQNHSKQMDLFKQSWQEVTSTLDQLNHTVEDLECELAESNAAIERQQQRLVTLRSNLFKLRALNDRLTRAQHNRREAMLAIEQKVSADHQLQLQAKREQVEALQDQLRDLHFFINTRTSVEGGDLHGGSVVSVNEMAASQRIGGRRRGRGYK